MNPLLTIANYSGNLLSLNTYKRWSGISGILPVYHGIDDIPMPHIKHLYRHKGTEAFTRDLDFLCMHYKAVDLNEFKEHTGPAFLLTFDDGLRQCADVIMPILKQKGIPAIFFINTAFIDNKDLFYRYKAGLLIEEMNSGEDKNPGVKRYLEQKGLFRRNVVHSIKNIGYRDRAVLDEIARLMNYSFRNFLDTYKPYMTTEQINSLLSAGFSIGSHSIDHPEYRFIAFEEQVRQTRESMDDLAAIFDLDYRYFAFPFTDFGVGRRFFETVFDGKIIDHSFGCAGMKEDMFRNHFQRIPMEGYDVSAETIIKSEYLYYLLKGPMGRNRINRA